MNIFKTDLSSSLSIIVFTDVEAVVRGTSVHKIDKESYFIKLQSVFLYLFLYCSVHK